MTSEHAVSKGLSLAFTNKFTSSLPADPESGNFQRQVLRSCYSRVKPKTVSRPQLVSYSAEFAGILGLSKQECLSSSFSEVFSGNQQVNGMDPFAMCYGGHQFGHWAGQLGDGRAINLGEVHGENNTEWMLQLKGAGPTPYSRSADGLAVLRSSLREYLCSEAMFHLGVPTTRALSLILTGDSVARDMFYDGNPQWEHGAVVCRAAPTFLRFGNYQIHAARKERDVLKRLLDFTIGHHFPHLGKPSEEVYYRWYEEVCRSTADMIIHWMRVGFVHGVMNTDNMSILGLTIDYGPYGWLEDYNPGWTPNTTDAQGKRYTFANQPQIAYWNLAQLGSALALLFDNTERLQEILNQYPGYFESKRQLMMVRKLGLETYQKDLDDYLIDELLEILAWIETDMTLFYRCLAKVNTDEDLDEIGEDKLIDIFQDAYYLPQQVTASYKERLVSWLKAYAKRVKKEGVGDSERQLVMNSNNPKYVLRNYMAQLAIDKADEGDFTLVEELLALLRQPYDEQPDQEVWAQKRPDWARNRAGCSMLSCSS